MQQITPNVYVETKWIISCNPSFVTTSEGVVMIDAPYLPTDAVKWRDEIARRGELRYLINTEHHRDHTTGTYFFSGVGVAHELVRKWFTVSQGTPDEVRQRFRQEAPEVLPLLDKYQPGLPIITFSERLALYLGEHTFELIHLPGHTPGQTGVFVPEEKVIFTGDNVANGFYPKLAQSYPVEWVESLRKIEAMDVDFVVPGHGEVCDKQVVREFAAFIQECIDRVSAAIKQGMSIEEAAERVSFEGNLPARHASREEVREDVMRVYQQLSR